MSDSYIVAYRYTEKAGSFKGVVTWTPFADKAAADEHNKTLDGMQEIVEEGITDERAVELTKTTPPKAYLFAAIEKATDSDGNVDLNRVSMEIQSAIFCIQTFLQA